MRAALRDMVIKDMAATLTSTVSNAVSSALSAMKVPKGGNNKTETRETQRPLCTCGSVVAKWKCEVGAHLGLSCALRCLCACLLCFWHAR